MSSSPAKTEKSIGFTLSTQGLGYKITALLSFLYLIPISTPVDSLPWWAIFLPIAIGFVITRTLRVIVRKAARDLVPGSFSCP